MDNPVCWELDAPALYRYELTVEGLGQTESLSRKYGYREIASDGPKITLNGRPVYARGVLHWGCDDDDYPQSVQRDHPRRNRALQGLRLQYDQALPLYSERSLFLSWPTSSACFLWVELPVWLPDPTPELEPRIKREFLRILEQMQGHPPSSW